jgi:7-carboxy-7-deazaguanine synthase
MLAVNEIYGPVAQGEGASSGMPCIFLRLSGCNLACIWCFIGYTKIATPKGSRNIKDIRVGDLVLSSDGRIIVPKKVTKIFKRETSKDEIVRVLVEGDPGVVNNRVYCTKNHEFSTNRGWVSAQDLKPGDEIEFVDNINWHMKNDNPSCRPEAKQRLSEMGKRIHTGRRASTETRLRLRASKLGPKNPRYTGTCNDPGYLTLWYRTRRDVLKRDGYKCQNCGSTENLEVHHSIPFKISKSHDPGILITLCRSCHRQAERQFLHNGKKVVSVTPVSVKQAARFNGNSKVIEVYNLEVEDNHTYFANSFLVHNCDTPYTWNWGGTKFEHPDKYDPKLEMHTMSVQEVSDEIYEKSEGIRLLVISGGEPMLQQSALIHFLRKLKDENPNWWVEVETNGTVEPHDEFITLINQFNCSPKLSNAGKDNPRSKRLKFHVLKKIKNSGKGTFKFVIQSEIDLEEMREILHMAEIPPSSVWLMPEGRTREEQLARQEQVERMTKEHGYNFSPRLHILEHDNKRAV